MCYVFLNPLWLSQCPVSYLHAIQVPPAPHSCLPPACPSNLNLIKSPANFPQQQLLITLLPSSKSADN